MNMHDKLKVVTACKDSERFLQEGYKLLISLQREKPIYFVYDDRIIDECVWGA